MRKSFLILTRQDLEDILRALQIDVELLEAE
jgi:hypothetical protein